MCFMFVRSGVINAVALRDLPASVQLCTRNPRPDSPGSTTANIFSMRLNFIFHFI